MTTRLETVAPGLARLVGHASPSQRRRAALRAAELALDASGLDDDRVRNLLGAVERGVVGDCPERAAVRALVEALDEAYWDLQDQVASGEATPDRHLPAFSRARAAAACYFAAERDTRLAAVEAIYEAGAAVEDHDDLWPGVTALLTEEL